MANELLVTSENAGLLPTGSTVKAVLRRATDTWFYNRATGLFQAPAPHGQAQSYIGLDVPMTETPDGSRQWFGDVPSGAQGIALVPPAYYLQAGASWVGPPTDTFLGTDEFSVVTGVAAFTPPPPGAATGHYTSEAAIAIMAPLFADLISQTDAGSTGPNTTRYQAAITSVETWMDTQLRIYGYPAPLTNSSIYFGFAQDVATKDTLVELYQTPRGINDKSDTIGGQLASLRYAAKNKYTEGGQGVRDQWIDLLKSGSLDVSKGDARQTSPISTIAPLRRCGYGGLVSGVLY